MGGKELAAQGSSSGFLGQAYSAEKGGRLQKEAAWNQWMQLSLARLRKRHLVRLSIYSKIKVLIPAFVLASAWFAEIVSTSSLHLHNLLNTSLTLRHVLSTVAFCVLWKLTTDGAGDRTSSNRAVLDLELWLLLRGSIVCGLATLVVSGYPLNRPGDLSLALSVAARLLVGSSFLLLAAFLVSAGIIWLPGRARKALIVGSGPRASFARTLSNSGHARLEFIGCVDDEYVGKDAATDKYLGDLQSLPGLLKAHPVELVLIGLPVKSNYAEIQQVIAVCESVGVETRYMLDVFDTTRASQQQPAVAGEFAVVGDTPRGLQHWIKRGIDLSIAGFLLLLLAPVMAVIAIAVKRTSSGPAFFVQQRYGHNRRRFPMFKFRTMVTDAEQLQANLETLNEAAGPVFKLKADPRITKIGALLRRTSLDELPQLFNVLRGEMSLVGPRPLPVRDVSRFDEAWLLRRFSVVPGLTCLWQVRGRSNTSFDEWIKLDLEYIDRWSLLLDLKILLHTIPAVMRGSGAM